MHHETSTVLNHSQFARRTGVLLCATVAVLAACSDGTGPGSAPRFGLAFRVDNPAFARSSASAAASDGGTVPVVTVTAAGLRIGRDSDTIIVTKAQLVVRDVKLRKTGVACTDDDSDATLLSAAASLDRDGKDGDHEADEDECPMLRIGPFLVDLPVNGADASTIAVNVPEGSYQSVHFHLHPAGDKTPDEILFRENNPDFRGISVRLEGLFDGKPFVFVGDVNAFIDVPLTAPLIVGATGTTVTVAIDLAGWFSKSTKGLVSPASANVPGAARNQVLHNIQVAFRAFRDDDHDGHED